jgi:hypothetical protein
MDGTDHFGDFNLRWNLNYFQESYSDGNLHLLATCLKLGDLAKVIHLKINQVGIFFSLWLLFGNFGILFLLFFTIFIWTFDL